MAVFSGKEIYGEAASSEILDLQQFEITDTADPQVYSSSSTTQAKKRTPGVADVTGSITCAVHASGVTIPSTNIRPGVGAALDLWEKKAVNATKHTFAAVVWGEVTYGVDGDTGAIVTATITFGNNGQYTRPDSSTVGA